MTARSACVNLDWSTHSQTAIARAMICNYPYFLLDEPTSSLDNKNIEKVITLIDKLKKNGCAIIGIFHDEMIRNEIADREIDVNSFK